MGIRDRIEAAFERWGRFVFRNARSTIAFMLLLTLGLGTQLPELYLDTGSEAFLKKTDPVRVTYERFQEQFGREGVVLIAIEPPQVFDLAFLEKLRAFHEDLENEVPYLEDITSLINARSTRGEADELIVEDLMEDWPQDAAALAEIEQRALANPLYRNFLLSENGRITTVMIETETYSSQDSTEELLADFEESEAPEAQAGTTRIYLTGDENNALVQAVYGVIERYRGPDFRVHVAGQPVLMEEISTAISRDMMRFVALSLLTIAALLWILFRRLSGVTLPLIVVSLSLLSTLALMAASGVPITIPTQILPSFLLAVGVGAAIHILAIFYQARRSGADREGAIARALGHSGLAIAMTSLTTAGGLLSFMAAELAPIAEFGLFAPIGVMISFVYTVVMLPALLAVVPLHDKASAARAERPLLDRLLVFFGDTATRYAWTVVVVSAALLGVSFAGMSRLALSHHPINWFEETHPFRVATQTIDDEFQGTMSLEMLVRTDIENGLHDPELLSRLDELRVYLEGVEHQGIRVGKTISLADILKEIHQALNENRPEYYAIPEDRRLVAQEFLLFENTGTDDLEDVVDTQFRLGSFTVRIPQDDAMRQVPVLDAIDARFREVLGDAATVTMTGGLVLSDRSFFAMIRSMADSYVIALLVVTPLMVLMLGSLRGGLLSMIPNVTPIVLTLGLMGWLGVPIDFSTMMSGAIVLGIAVDDTIHFAHNFQRFYARGDDPAVAVRRSLETAGRAMLFTSIVLAAGFLIYAFSTLENLVNLGVFTAFAIATAFLADVLVAPALMVLFQRRPRHSPAAATTGALASVAVSPGTRRGSWGSRSATGR